MKRINKKAIEEKSIEKTLKQTYNTYEFLHIEDFEYAIFKNRKTGKEKKVKLPYKEGGMVFMGESFHLEKAVDHLPVKQAIAVNPKVIFPDQLPTMVLGKKRPASQLPHGYSRRYAVIEAVTIRKQHDGKPDGKINFFVAEFTLDA